MCVDKGDSEDREVKLIILLVFVQNVTEMRASHCNHTSLNAVILCLQYSNQSRGQDSSVGIATGNGLDSPGIDSRWG
jgi:hypothetical protein